MILYFEYEGLEGWEDSIESCTYPPLRFKNRQNWSVKWKSSGDHHSFIN